MTFRLSRYIQAQRRLTQVEWHIIQMNHDSFQGASPHHFIDFYINISSGFHPAGCYALKTRRVVEFYFPLMHTFPKQYFYMSREWITEKWQEFSGSTKSLFPWPHYILWRTYQTKILKCYLKGSQTKIN